MYRKIEKYLLLLMIPLLSFSCEFQSFEDYEFPEYDGAFKWTQLSKHAEWPKRYGHAAVSYDDKIWIFGGYNPGLVKGDTYLEDVWSSADGVTWDLVLDTAPWLGRRGHRVTVFDDGSGEAMFLIGGFTVNEETGYREYANDVWKSTNGKDWIELKERTYPELDATDDWFPRFNHALLSVNHGGIDYLYVIGGASMLEDHSARYAMKYFNDVWRSVDGINWEKLNNNDFGIRSEAGATVDPATGRIFIQGGVHGVNIQTDDNQSHPSEDWHWLWSSLDGTNWIPENDTAIFDQDLLWRSDHQLVFYNNSLWGLPGKTTSNVHYHFTSTNQYPIWNRVNEEIWQVDSYGCDIDPRHAYATVVMDNKIFILGGFTSSYGQSNDVWTGEIN